MIEIKPNIDMDFSEHAFCIAVGQLEINPEDATVWVPGVSIARAYEIKEKFKCKVIAIPNALARSNFCWGVANNQGTIFWSAGIC